MGAEQNKGVQERNAENFQRLREDLLRQGYTETVATLSVLKANLFALITAGPFAVLAVVLFLFRWNLFTVILVPMNLLWFILLMIAAIVVHELLHGMVWAFFCRQGLRSIHIGVMWKQLTPYCHCNEPLPVPGYLLGGLAPFLLLGVGIFLAAYFTGSLMLLLLSVVNIVAAGGDLTIACMLLQYRHAVVLDHPSECGFVAFTRA